MPFNMKDFVNDDGTFKPEFKTAVPAQLGDEYKDTKALDDLPNFLALVKSGIDTKKAMGRKLEGVIQKPADDAPPEQKEAYRKTLLAELGAGQSIEDYKFAKPDKLPEGMPWDEAMDELFMSLFFTGGVPVDVARQIRDTYINQATKGWNIQMEQEQQQFEEAAREFQMVYPGDKGVAAARQAHGLLMKIGSDDLKNADGTLRAKGLKTILKESNVFGNPTDFKAWRKNGIEPGQLMMLAKLAEQTGSGTTQVGEPPKQRQPSGEASLVNAINAGSPGLQVPAA